MRILAARLATAVAAGALAGLAGTAGAATATGQFQVTLTVNAECRLVSASDLAFGTAGVIQANIDAASTLEVQCTNSTPFNIGLGPGRATGATVSTRRMGASAGGTIGYQLYRDAARTQAWGETINTDTLASTGTGAVQSFQVYGRVPPQNTPAPGNYTDTVRVVVTY